MMELFGNIFFQTDPTSGRQLLRAMPLLLGLLCILAIAYRYYSAFLAAKVLALDSNRTTPAHQLDDGSNYHPTNRWVLFGHHFAAIAGAGPLIGPVLAMQYGYAPGLLWLVIGVCLAGAVQDMTVLAASVRHGGKSLAEMARIELGKTSGVLASLAILVIVVIALAGLSIIVVKALGGDTAVLPAGMTIRLPEGKNILQAKGSEKLVDFPAGCYIRYRPSDDESARPEGFRLSLPNDAADEIARANAARMFTTVAKTLQIIPGSSWGTFTIACTIPIALFVGLWMHKIRPGHIIEASIIGGLMTLAAVIGGAEIRGTALEPYFSLSREGTIIAIGIYGFIAAVLPIWLLLTPRDYLSSFLKIGTLILLIIGVIVANPALRHPPLNETFANGGPTFPGGLFPFVFICIMCGAISGFHALVSSGTTPKMIDNERDIRPIGYGAMLIEGLVGIIALIAAAAMPPELYYAINVNVKDAPDYEQRLQAMYKDLNHNPEANDPLTQQLESSQDITHLDPSKNLASIEEAVGGESLRGRSGGAVTLAVSMATILTEAFTSADREIAQFHRLMSYWYHFAIMFEALFILTVIDAGTRIARYLMQETLGKIYSPFASSNWLPGALIATGLVTIAWCSLVWSGQIGPIWSMFGIANQLLGVLALAVVSTVLVRMGKRRYLWVLIVPMVFVASTTTTAGKILVQRQLNAIEAGTDVGINRINLGLTLFVIISVYLLVLRCVAAWFSPARRNL